MRAFVVACLAAVVLAAAAAIVLNSGYLPDSSASVFTSESVRI